MIKPETHYQILSTMMAVLLAWLLTELVQGLHHGQRNTLEMIDRISALEVEVRELCKQPAEGRQE